MTLLSATNENDLDRAESLLVFHGSWIMFSLHNFWSYSVIPPQNMHKFTYTIPLKTFSYWKIIIIIIILVDIRSFFFSFYYYASRKHTHKNTIMIFWHSRTIARVNNAKVGFMSMIESTSMKLYQMMDGLQWLQQCFIGTSQV